MNKFSVFVDSIVKQEGGIVNASASNGGRGGPPMVVWQLSTEELPNCYIGKKYIVQIDEG